MTARHRWIARTAWGLSVLALMVSIVIYISPGFQNASGSRLGSLFRLIALALLCVVVWVRRDQLRTRLSAWGIGGVESKMWIVAGALLAVVGFAVAVAIGAKR